MNNTRRAQITDLLDKLYELQSELESIRDDEQEVLGNMMEHCCGTERCDRCQEAANNLDEACEAMDSLKEYLEAAQD